MKYTIALFALLFTLFTPPLHAQKVVMRQQTDKNITPLTYADGRKETFTYREQMPQPPYDLNKYLAGNLRYPIDADTLSIQGKVYIKFLVRSTGAIDSASVQRGIFPSLDAEALRVVTSMSPWIPCKQDGKIIDVWFTVPVIFKLE